MLNTEADRIEVAAGIVVDGAGRVLIAQRCNTAYYQGWWEFPGGKIRNGESRQEALRRELQEEVGISVVDARHFQSFPYDYPERRVMLHFFIVSKYDGTARPCEDQPLDWAFPSELNDYNMLDANSGVISELMETISPSRGS